jgi:hypothetical protein
VEEPAVTGIDDQRSSDEDRGPAAAGLQSDERPREDRAGKEQRHHDLCREAAAGSEQAACEQRGHGCPREHRPRKHRVFLAELHVVAQVDAEVAPRPQGPPGTLEGVDGNRGADEHECAATRAGKPFEALKSRHDTRTECGRPRREHRGARSYW